MKSNKKLRSGITTGSCAAAAAKAAAYMLLTGQTLSKVNIDTPKGIELKLPVLDIRIKGGLEKKQVSCAVRKDSGDDPDITNGILIYASVEKNEDEKIIITAGKGIGKVTKPGLACEVGEAAINPQPRKMILSEVQKVCTEVNYKGGLSVTIYVPEGERIAARTFNPRLGIIGGISILGTTGIIEPMSEKAWIDTIYLEMKQQYALGKRNILICPGNYGEEFVGNYIGLETVPVIQCSNFIGEALDFAEELEFESLLLIGHAGKLVKLGAGIMNTHSRYADARMEVLAVHAALQGAGGDKVRRIMSCNTTEEAVDYLREEGICGAVFESLMERIDFYVQSRFQGKLKTGVIIFSNQHGILGRTRYAAEILEKLKNKG